MASMTLQEAVDAATWEDVISFVEGLPADVDLWKGNVCLICPVSRYLAARVEKPGLVAVGLATVDLLRTVKAMAAGETSVETVELTPVLVRLVRVHMSKSRMTKKMFLDAAKKRHFLPENQT